MFEGNQNNLGMLSNKIETSIENKEVTPEQLPQGSPIQQEAKQVYDSNPNNNEVNNKAVDDYVNLINENFGEGIKYIKPNYETLKNFPVSDLNFDKPETLTDSYWWEEQMARNEMFDNPRTKNYIKLQPGFDYDFDAIKADYPEAYYMGESPEELKQKAHDALIEDAFDEYNKSGDISILEDYIKENGTSPVSIVGSYEDSLTNEGKLFYALRKKYPELVDRWDMKELQKLLLDKDNVEEVEVDPITAAMNEGLSEDDPDYFGYNERIEKPIAKTGRRINA